MDHRSVLLLLAVAPAALRLDGRLRRGDPGDGDAEGAARDVMQAALCG